MAAAVPAAPPPYWDATNKTSKDISREKLSFLQTQSKDVIARRMCGQYFTSMEDLWGVNAVEFGQVDFDRIARRTAQGRLYEACYTHLDQNIRGAGCLSASTNHRDNAIKLDMFGNSSCESAHLFSHDKSCHKAYGFVAEAAIGIYFDQLTATGRRTRDGRLLRAVTRFGAPNEEPPKQKRLKILAGVENYNGSSLESHEYSKVFLEKQGQYYDTDDPSILIIPLLTLQQVMDWATDDTTSAIEYDVMAVTFGEKSEEASAILTHALHECTPSEIELGRSLLETFVVGLAGSLKSKAVKESFTEDDLQNPELYRWSSLVNNIVDGTVTRIDIPAQKQSDTAVHVAKGRMSLGTSLPDPWLLMLKAAINYSASRGTKLMPACPPEEDDDGPPNTIQGMEMEQPQESLLGDSLQRVRCLFTERPLIDSS